MQYSIWSLDNRKLLLYPSYLIPYNFFWSGDSCSILSLLKKSFKLIGAASHKRAVLSREPVTIVFPSGENATENTQLKWPTNSFTIFPFISHKHAVLSKEPVRTFFPSGENATDQILF